MNIKRKSTLWERLIVVVLVLFALCLVATAANLIHGCSKLGKRIDDKGLKKVIEEVWEGADHG